MKGDASDPPGSVTATPHKTMPLLCRRRRQRQRWRRQGEHAARRCAHRDRRVRTATAASAPRMCWPTSRVVLQIATQRQRMPVWRTTHQKCAAVRILCGEDAHLLQRLPLETATADDHHYGPAVQRPVVAAAPAQLVLSATTVGDRAAAVTARCSHGCVSAPRREADPERRRPSPRESRPRRHLRRFRGIRTAQQQQQLALVVVPRSLTDERLMRPGRETCALLCVAVALLRRPSRR